MTKIGKKGATKSSRTSGAAKAKKAQAKAPATKAQKAKPAVAREEFAGTAKGQVGRPQAELPRSGWKDAGQFTEAARAARGDALTGGGRPVIRPLYGLPMEIPLPRMDDRALRDAAKNILRDRRISLTEVESLINAAKDNGGLSKTEKKDLRRLMDQVGERFDVDALRRLEKFVSNESGPPRPDPVDPGPVIRPLYGLPVPVPIDVKMKDKKLDAAVKDILGDRKITLDEVNKLIDVAADGRGLSRTERDDLKRLIDEASFAFHPAALAKLKGHIGDLPSPLPMYGMPFVFPGPQVSIMTPMGMGPGMRPASSLPTVELSHAKKFVEIAKHNGGLTSMEQSEMRALLAGGANFTAEARKVMEDFMRTQH